MLAELDEEFKNLKRDHPERITKEKIEKLAKEYGFLTGKWMLMVPNQKADEIWQKIGKAVLDKKIPKSLYIKMNGKDDDSKIYEGTSKISVVTADFTKKSDVFDVVNQLREICPIPLGRLKYKADIYTRFDLFANNEFNIRPSLYVSEDSNQGFRGGFRGRGRGRGTGI